MARWHVFLILHKPNPEVALPALENTESGMGN